MNNFFFGGGVVIVTQLVERLLPIKEVLVSNPDIGKIYIEHEYTVSCIKKTKIKERRPAMANF